MTTENQHTAINQTSGIVQRTVDWAETIKCWKLSGLSQVAYCKANNISINQFTYQYAKLSTRDKSNSKLLPINLVGNEQINVATNHFVLHYPNGTKVHIPVNAHPDA